MEKLVTFARIFADETRQQIMLCVCCNELSVNEVVEALKERGKTLTQPTVSHHLAELRDAGLVGVRHEGRNTYYTLNQEEVTVCCGQIMNLFAPTTSVDTASAPIIPLASIKKVSDA
jgi:ArsR family transcriptional regulator, arsenate/arsenite/antimonite-responsive transcriptional repressor